MLESAPAAHKATVWAAGGMYLISHTQRALGMHLFVHILEVVGRKYHLPHPAQLSCHRGVSDLPIAADSEQWVQDLGSKRRSKSLFSYLSLTMQLSRHKPIFNRACQLARYGLDQLSSSEAASAPDRILRARQAHAKQLQAGMQRAKRLLQRQAVNVALVSMEPNSFGSPRIRSCGPRKQPGGTWPAQDRTDSQKKAQMCAPAAWASAMAARAAALPSRCRPLPEFLLGCSIRGMQWGLNVRALPGRLYAGHLSTVVCVQDSGLDEHCLPGTRTATWHRQNVLSVS